ncbi:MAG: TetR/AcrR family transcriptional regulator [Coriobacteriia bacterium]|nr:TetR/AcrR family transcriptional regulator [Coriobacteriia bacterium]
MNAAFMELPEERQQAILNAAYDEFGANGYDRASTNAIVSAAGISKGTLFNYFGSKSQLFKTLANFALGLVNDVYISQLDSNQTDFLEKYRQATQVKYQAYRAHPHEFGFFNALYFYDSKEPVVVKEVKRTQKIRTEAEAFFSENNDTSLFIEHLDPTQAIRLMQYCLAGYERDMMAGIRNHATSLESYDLLWEDFYRYLDLLRSVFYRKGA